MENVRDCWNWSLEVAVPKGVPTVVNVVGSPLASTGAAPLQPGWLGSEHGVTVVLKLVR